MSNKSDEFATHPNPVTSATNAFGTLPAELRVVALAAALIDADPAFEERLRTLVFRVSGTRAG